MTGTPDARDTTPNAPQAHALSGHVLVVEDNRINQLLIAAYLDRFGLTHVMTDNGHAALAALADGVFDVVLMDVMMPGLDGIETMRRMRAMGGAVAQTPIIALTANAMKGDREAYLAAGMDGYVSKPIDVAVLHEVLATAMAARSAG